ncbi:MAG TPA: putative metal-binding motif-containing protein [Polyangiaceae bacterium]
MHHGAPHWTPVAFSCLGALAVLVVAACSGTTPTRNGFGSGGGGSGGGQDPGSSSGGGSGGTDDGGPSGNFGDDGGSRPNPLCQYDDGTDHDGDGFSGTDGDCNDCDPNANPGAFDVPKNGVDEDCDGVPDDEPSLCDTSVALDSNDGMDAAKAIGLCRQTSETATGKQRTWGVVGASYVMCDGSPAVASANFPLGHGLLSKLGVNVPLEGKHMLAISSGTARDPTDPGYQDVGGFDKGFTCTPPSGYPKESPACPGVTTGQPHDCVALRLVIRVPTNAKSFAYNENFFTYEFPDYICSTYNDFFVAMMTPKLANLPDGNIAFDQAGNPVSVNNSLLQVCTAQTAGGKTFACPLGASTLSATGFDGHAATGWLKTQAPVDTLKGKDVTLMFAVWDSGDGVLDSSALVDDFVWSVDPASGATTVPNPPQ